jgi:hypothetical protein
VTALPCPSCGLAFKAGKRAIVVAARGTFTPSTVCRTCAARGLLVVFPDAARDRRLLLAPLADKLRKLALGYQRSGDVMRGEGLRQAADIVADGRAADVVDALAPTALAPTLREKGNPPPTANGAGRELAQTKRERPLASPRRSAEIPGSVPGGLSKSDRAVLAALAERYPRPMSDAQISIVTRYRRSGGFRGTLARLRAAGLIEGAGHANVLTAEGRRAAGDVAPLPKGAELLELWCSRLGECASIVLQALVSAYPAEIPLGALAERTGYRPSGGFRGALAKLRRLELVAGSRASEVFMEEIRGWYGS